MDNQKYEEIVTTESKNTFYTLKKALLIFLVPILIFFVTPILFIFNDTLGIEKDLIEKVDYIFTGLLFPISVIICSIIVVEIDRKQMNRTRGSYKFVFYFWIPIWLFALIINYLS